MNQLTLTSLVVAALLLLATTYVQESTSFILSSTHHHLSRHPSTSTSTAINAKKKGRQTNVPRPLPTGPPPQDINLPEDISMEQLLDVLGEKRLKKMARKNRRSRNQKIREGKVVLNELGEWVDRE